MTTITGTFEYGPRDLPPFDLADVVNLAPLTSIRPKARPDDLLGFECFDYLVGITIPETQEKIEWALSDLIANKKPGEGKSDLPVLGDGPITICLTCAPDPHTDIGAGPSPVPLPAGGAMLAVTLIAMMLGSKRARRFYERMMFAKHLQEE